MTCLGYTNKIPLPNRDLGLYAVSSYTFDLQVKEAASHRSASARLTHEPWPRYYGNDPIPEGLVVGSH
jgi:hypothetical protein